MRRGQTEAAIGLASLAGLYPAGMICEVVNDDGTTARVPDLSSYRFEMDEHGALAAIEGVVPVYPRHSVLEET